MAVKGMLEQAAHIRPTSFLEVAVGIRREARRVWFLASGPSQMHSALIAAAVALERAAGEVARQDNYFAFRKQA